MSILLENVKIYNTIILEKHLEENVVKNVTKKVIKGGLVGLAGLGLLSGADKLAKAKYEKHMHDDHTSRIKEVVDKNKGVDIVSHDQPTSYNIGDDITIELPKPSTLSDTAKGIGFGAVGLGSLALVRHMRKKKEKKLKSAAEGRIF